MYKGLDYTTLKHVDMDGMKYRTVAKDFVFYWFDHKTITIAGLWRTNGADKVKDLAALAWHVHDWICKHPFWDDGTPISNLKASWIYRSILLWSGVKVRSRIRFLGTFLFGGKHIKSTTGWI